MSRATQLSISVNRRSLTFAIWALNTYSFSWPRDSVKKDTIKNTIKTNDLYKLSELNYRMKICKNHILSKFKNTYFQIWLFCTLNPTNALGKFWFDVRHVINGFFKPLKRFVHRDFPHNPHYTDIKTFSDEFDLKSGRIFVFCKIVIKHSFFVILFQYSCIID